MSNNWWADKLGTTSTPLVANAPVPPTYTPQPVSTPPVEPPPTFKAQSSRETESCPNCFGGNYMSNVGARKRCYDCGYPIIQSGSGASSVSSGAAATPAKQRGQEGGYNPNIIVGKVD